ncbi:MAG: hypothetical protein H7224_02530 [Polaromonas sp.]|nr:hypothetical protein [Polaromonas sp.]
MKTLSNWRSVRLWEGKMSHQLRQRHWLRFHGLCIGTLVMTAMWGVAHLQMRMGSESLALRYLLTLGTGYVVYLLTLRLWAGVLLRRDAAGSSIDDGLVDGDLWSLQEGTDPDLPGYGSGGSGNFGGGGASGDFSNAAMPDAALGSDLGDVAGGALDAAASADDGAIVVVPVVAVFLIGMALVFGVGSLLMLYFGWEALLAVAIELAFTYVSARTAVRVAREGWLSAAVRLTWKPMLGALLCAVLLGAVIDHFIPAAQSLPQAIRWLQQNH